MFLFFKQNMRITLIIQRFIANSEFTAPMIKNILTFLSCNISLITLCLEFHLLLHPTHPEYSDLCNLQV